MIVPERVVLKRTAVGDSVVSKTRNSAHIDKASVHVTDNNPWQEHSNPISLNGQDLRLV